jgi:hypothetical protein
MPTTAMERAAASCGVPLAVHRIEHKGAAALYEKTRVLMRPDGHVPGATIASLWTRC